MTKKSRVFTLAAVMVVIILILASPRLQLFERESASGNSDSAATLAVSGFVVAAEQLQSRINTSGTVLPNEEVELRSEIAGKITAIAFREGSGVRKGELLVKINDADRRAQLLRLEYQGKLAEANEFRQRSLLEKGATSQEVYDVALNEFNKVKAEIAVLQADLAKTEIRAPFDGIVGLRYVSEGSYISPTARIASLINQNPVKLDFAIPEKYAGMLNPGATFDFKITGVSRNFRGRVYAIEPRIDPATRTVKLRAQCPNEEGLIVPGAFAEIELILDSVDDALMIPSEALVPELQGQMVFIYQSGKAMRREVKIGLRTGDHIQITSGLHAGDTLITSGILQLRPEMDVTLAEIITTGTTNGHSSD